MPPANTTAATAVDLGTLPASVTQSDIRDGTTVYDVWYRVTVPAGVIVLGVFGFGNLTAGATGYKPAFSIYTGPASSPVPYPVPWPIGVDNVPAVNVPAQVPVTPGTTYYLQFSTTTTDATPAILTLSVQAAPTLTATVGSLLVNDDQDPFAAAVLSETDGSVRCFRADHPAGEAGAILMAGSGAYALEDDFHDQLALFTSAGVRVATIAATTATALTSNLIDRFYFVTGTSPALVRTCTADGTLGPTTWTLTGSTSVVGIGLNPNEDVLYYVSSDTPTVLRRWDLVANVAVSTLAMASAGYQYDRRDILVLSDGTLLLSQTHTVALTAQVLHYSPAGAVLHTFTLGTVVSDPDTRLAYALDSPTSFWVYLHLAAGRSRFVRLHVSAGTVLQSFEADQFNAGVYGGAQTATPTRFGHSKSCPFLILPVVGTPPASYHLEERYIRRLRRAPHVNNDNQRVFVRRFELDLERGQGLASGQGSDPIVLLRLSRDGGQTWGEESRMHAGALGAYTQRCLARRLGQSRDTVFEVTVSDPIAWSLVGAWLDVEPGAH